MDQDHSESPDDKRRQQLREHIEAIESGTESPRPRKESIADESNATSAEQSPPPERAKNTGFLLAVGGSAAVTAVLATGVFFLSQVDGDGRLNQAFRLLRQSGFLGVMLTFFAILGIVSRLLCLQCGAWFTMKRISNRRLKCQNCGVERDSDSGYDGGG